MADLKISELAEVSDLLQTDEFILARSSATNKITGATLSAFLGGAGDGWTADLDTWTYASASTFTVSGDVTARFSKGTRLKFTQTTTKYAVVRNSTHAAGTTTVTIAVNDDYTIANASLDSTYYSYTVNPQGYPGWFNFTPTITGFSTSGHLNNCRYRIDGNMCHFYFDNFNTSGTSNATTFTVTVPVSPAINQMPFASNYVNNGTQGTTPGMIRTQNATLTLDLYTNWNAAAWTNSGTKWARFLAIYQF